MPSGTCSRVVSTRATASRTRGRPVGAEACAGSDCFYSLGTVLVLIGFGTASSIAIKGLEENFTPWAGGFERINAYAFAWLVVLAVTVMRRPLNEITPEKGATETAVVQTREPSIAARG